MAISWDAHTLAAANYTSTGTQNTTHACGANARGAVVVITQISADTDQVSGVTFNGAAMTRLEFVANPDEAAGVYLYFLDGISGQGGNVTVAMTTTGNSGKRLSVHTLNTQGAEYAVEAASNSTGVASGTNPSVTVSGLSTGRVYLGVMGVHSSLNAFPNTPGSGWTANHYADEGTEGVGQAYLTNTTTGVTSLAATWTAGTDGYAVAAAALSEGPRTQVVAATGATVALTAAATPGGTAKPEDATGATVTISAAALPAAMTKTTTATGSTVTLTAAAAGDKVSPGTYEQRGITGPPKSYGTVTGRLGKVGTQTHTTTATGATVTLTAAAAAFITDSATATAVTVTVTAAATPANMTKSTTATVSTVTFTAAATPAAITKSTTGTTATVTVTASAAGQITDDAVANATVTITASATPGGTAKPQTATVSTVTISSTATPGAMTKPATATTSTVTLSTTAVPAAITKSTTATAVTATATAASQGEVWRTRFYRPDAILSMTGLAGTVLLIQDSPTSPNAEFLAPTTGAVDLRFSFEGPPAGKNLRTGAGYNIIRVLASVAP